MILEKINIPNDKNKNCEFSATINNETIKFSYNYEALEKRHYIGFEYKELKVEKMRLVSGGIINFAYKNIMNNLLLFVFSPFGNDPEYSELEFTDIQTSFLFVADMEGYKAFLNEYYKGNYA